MIFVICDIAEKDCALCIRVMKIGHFRADCKEIRPCFLYSYGVQ